MEQISPHIACVLAPNPSPMTYTGTNSYLVGNDRVVVIDPGPILPAHQTALIRAVADRPVDAILVTHAHVDHSPLARPLGDLWGVPVLAYGDASAGRSAIMEQLADQGLTGGGEGVDAGFTPDACLSDGDTVATDAGPLRALWTPGHFGNHLCFALGDTLFTGDLVMGWASSLVSPPDGDLTQFMASCRRLLRDPWRLFLPGHGAAINAPLERLNWLISHRESRESQILDALDTPRSVTDLTAQIYTEVAPQLLPAAERNVLAHLIDLHERGLVQATPTLSVRAEFSRR